MLTILGKKIVVENGQFYGDLGAGRWIKRKVSHAILPGPAF